MPVRVPAQPVGLCTSADLPGAVVSEPGHPAGERACNSGAHASPSSSSPEELADRLLQVQENRRHRLSRELHDDIGNV